MSTKKKKGIDVLGFAIENFHRIRVAQVRLEPGAGLVRITGRNGAGKTSTLRAFKAAFGGAGEVLPEAVVNAESVDGKGSVTFELDNGFTIERRFTETNPKGSLYVIGPDGGTHGQAKLNEWLGPLSFDPLAFFSLKPARQTEILLSLGDPALPVELHRLREEQERIREERSPWIVKKREAMKREKPEGERPEPIDVAAELDRKDELDEVTLARRVADEAVREVEAAYAREKEIERRIEDRIRELEEELRVTRLDLAEQSSKVDERYDEIQPAREALAALPDPREELAAVNARLRQAADVQEALGPWIRYEELEEAEAHAREREQELTAEIEDLVRQEADLLANAGLPVEGLSFDGETTLLNGQPLSVASGAEKMKLAVAVAVAANPDLRVALIDEANDLDLEGLEALDELAKEHDFRIFACRIGLEGPGEIVVEDGRAFNRSDS